jgi:hypothetical protein
MSFTEFADPPQKRAVVVGFMLDRPQQSRIICVHMQTMENANNDWLPTPELNRRFPLAASDASLAHLMHCE